VGLILFENELLANTDDTAALEQISATPPKQGNFALPSPQQPGPLLSFGQTLIGRNHLQLAVDTYTPYPGTGFNSVDATMTYGLTDDTSVYFDYPLRADASSRVFRGNHLLDATLQLEQAIYTAGNAHYQEQATVVGAMILPLDDVNGRVKRRGHFSQVSYGAPAYFLGTTYNRTGIHWMGFVSPGFLLTTESDQVRLGSQYYYQAGIGRDLIAVADRSILFALLELNGQYTIKDEILQLKLRNTGGNIITLTPSLSLATQDFIVQAGVGFPIVQTLNGNQQKMDYLVAANFTWTIV
jgi:hypothetical protein